MDGKATLNIIPTAKLKEIIVDPLLEDCKVRKTESKK